MSSITCPNASCGATLEGSDLRHCPRCGAFLPLPEQDVADPLVGQPILHGKYRILSVIGEGGMGKVYLAEQKLGAGTRKVAIKTLQPDLAGDPQIIARFLREADTVGQLEHPNTIKFFDSGTLEEHGRKLFVVMEFIQGESLAHLLARGAIEVPRAERIMAQVCGSLQEAHEHGIIHRDLKPENIYLTQRGARGDFVKVLDFGIAKRTEAVDDKEAKLTRQGMVLGTPPYMSPEQFTGQALDGRSDIYALGIIAYEMLTGNLPFTAATPWEWATKHLTAPPTPLEMQPGGAQLPERHRRAIMRALAKNRDERQRTVIEFLAEFTGQSGEAASDWTASSTSLGATGGAPAGYAPTPAPHPFPSGPGTGPGAPHTGPGVFNPTVPSQVPFGPPGMAAGPSVPGGFAPAPTPNPFAAPSSGGYVPAPSNAGFAAVPPAVRPGGAGSNPGFHPAPHGGFQPVASSFGTAALPPKKSRAGLLVGIVGLVVVLAGGGLVLGGILPFGSDDPPPPVQPPSLPLAQTPPPTFPMPQPNVQAGLTPPSQPAMLPTPPPTPVEPTAPSMPTPPPLPVEPVAPSGGENPRAAAAVARGLSAAENNNFSGAISALQEAASIDRNASGLGRLRSELRRRGRNRIDNLILGGGCAQAQQLFRQLRSVGATPGTDSFGDACRAP